MLFLRMYILIIGPVLLAFFTFIKTKSWFFALFMFSIFFVYVRSSENLGLILLWLTYIIGLLSKKIVIKQKGFFNFILVAIILLATFLSVIHKESFSGAIAKYFKTLIVVLPFFTHKIKTVNKNNIIALIQSFIPIYIFFCILRLLLFDSITNLFPFIPRIFGLFTDPNYGSLILILFFFFLKYYSEKNHYLEKFLLIIFILLTQSLTVNFLFFGLFFFNFINLNWIRKKFSYSLFLFSLIFILYLFWLIETQPSTLQVFQSYRESAISLKLNSLIFRLRSALVALKLTLDSPSIWLFGYGSGELGKIAVRPMHNGFFQLIFDNGLIVASTVFIIIGQALKKIQIPVVLSLILLFSNLFLDNIFVFVFSFTYILFVLPDNIKTQKTTYTH